LEDLLPVSCSQKTVDTTFAVDRISW
jgi:hypothetical protein